MLPYVVAAANVPNFRAQVRYINYFIRFYPQGQTEVDLLMSLVEKIESYPLCVPEDEVHLVTESGPDFDLPTNIDSLIEDLTGLFSLSSIYFTREDDYFEEDHQTFPTPQEII